MHLQQAKFLISAAQAEQFPEDFGFEVAFAGRSNAGKSSALNAITHQKKLAHTSKTPGRTQLVNFFSLSDTQRLVDLPGYGFAKVSASQQRAWQALMESYFIARRSLAGVIVIMDIRHPLKDTDWQMLEYIRHYEYPLHVLLTKADKLSNSKQQQTLAQVSRELKSTGVAATLQVFSATKLIGRDVLQQQIHRWLMPV